MIKIIRFKSYNTRNNFINPIKIINNLYKHINIYTIIGHLVTQIDKVFGAASHKKVWDHFSKAQRKNIDLWKKQSMVRR